MAEATEPSNSESITGMKRTSFLLLVAVLCRFGGDGGDVTVS